MAVSRDEVMAALAQVATPGGGDLVSRDLIRALAIDKDHQPRWSASSANEITDDMVWPFFESPWPLQAHPLRDLSDAR